MSSDVQSIATSHFYIGALHRIEDPPAFNIQRPYQVADATMPVTAITVL